MKSGKTPYEIRSDLLQLAYAIVKGQKEAECAADQTTAETLADVIVNKAPTTDEVVAEAEKLNGFVSQLDGK